MSLINNSGDVCLYYLHLKDKMKIQEHLGNSRGVGCDSVVFQTRHKQEYWFAFIISTPSTINTKAVERFNRHNQRIRCCTDKHTMMFASCAYKLQFNNSSLCVLQVRIFLLSNPSYPSREYKKSSIIKIITWSVATRRKQQKLYGENNYIHWF